MNKAKSIACLMAAVLPMAALIGCTSNGDGGASSSPSATKAPSAAPSGNKEEVYPENGLSKTEKVTIKWGFNEDGFGREWADNAVKKFTEKYPNVKFEITASPVIRDLIGTKMATKNDNDMFDIISPSFNGDAGTVAMKEGLFEELSDLWERELPDRKGLKLKDSVLPNTRENALKVDGKFYSIPMASSALGLFYDKTLFEKNGWNQNPKTWDEFKKLVTDIKAKGIIPITYPGVYPGYLNFPFTMKQFELADKKGILEEFIKNRKSGKLPMYASPESKEMWTRIAEIGKLGAFPNGVAALNHTQSQMQLLQGKAAMAATGDWVQNEMKDAVPNGFKWGFMAIPFGDSPTDRIWIESFIGQGGLMIWKNKPEHVKKWAKEFNMFLLSSDIQAFNGKFGMSPIRKGIAEDPKLLEQIQEAPRAVLEFVKNNNAQIGNASTDVTLTHPSAAKAAKLVSDSTSPR